MGECKHTEFCRYCDLEVKQTIANPIDAVKEMCTQLGKAKKVKQPGSGRGRQKIDAAMLTTSDKDITKALKVLGSRNAHSKLTEDQALAYKEYAKMPLDELSDAQRTCVLNILDES